MEPSAPRSDPQTLLGFTVAAIGGLTALVAVGTVVTVATVPIRIWHGRRAAQQIEDRYCIAAMNAATEVGLIVDKHNDTIVNAAISALVSGYVGKLLSK